MTVASVSVVIPTYNRGAKIEKTIESIEQGTFPRKKFEIIIVDDCSQEAKSLEVKKISKGYSNIKYIQNKKNRGPSVSRNTGVKHSKGSLIFFTDDDCTVPKNWIERYVKFFEENKKVASVGSFCVPGSKNLFAKFEAFKIKLLKIDVKDEKIGHGEIQTGFTGNVAYRKKIFEELGGFNEKLRRGEDVELRRRVGEKYLIAAVYAPVVHNQEYNLDYFLSSLIKEGLECPPPETRGKKVWMIITGFPKMIGNSLRKLSEYRKDD